MMPKYHNGDNASLRQIKLEQRQITFLVPYLNVNTPPPNSVVINVGKIDDELPPHPTFSSRTHKSRKVFVIDLLRFRNLFSLLSA